MMRRNSIWLFCDIISLLLALFYTKFSAWAGWYREQTYDVLIAYLLVTGYLVIMHILYAVSVCIAFPALRQKGGKMLYFDAGIRLGVPIVVLAVAFIKYRTFAIIPKELTGLPVLAIVQYAEALYRKVFNRQKA